MPEESEELFAVLAAQIGAPPLTPEEVAAVLRLAKAVSDATERKFAPLTCYAAGLVIGAEEDEGDADRLSRLREIIDEVQGLSGGSPPA